MFRGGKQKQRQSVSYLSVIAGDGDGDRTYKEDRDYGEGHDGPALFDAFVCSLEGGLRLDDGRLLLFQRQEALELRVG